MQYSTRPAGTIKLLVLETDEPHPDTRRKRGGGFGRILDELFNRAGQKHDPPLSVETEMHFVVDDPAKGYNGRVPRSSEIPKDINAILLTGSMYDAHGADPWVVSLRSLLKDIWLHRPDIRLVGICFGHQLLAHVLGATVERAPDDKWELSHTPMDLTTVGQKLFRTTDVRLAVDQMHQDQVTTVPSAQTTDLLAPGTKVHVWASTEHTRIQGLFIRDRLFSSQGHLGFDESMVRRQVELRQKSGAIQEDDDEEVAYAEATAHMEHDGEVVAAAILRFFHGEDHDVP